MAKDKLFFIAILPPKEVMAEVNVFKEDMRDNHASSKALKVMPHITLKAPFKLPAEERGKVLEWFRNINTDIRPFPIMLKNFGSFDNRNNKVIFVKPVVTEAMATLQKNIILSFRQGFPDINLSTHENSFKPHMTIAYRDLTAVNYEKAWTIYKDKQYKAEFLCSSFCLLRHNGREWEVVQEYYLGEK